MSYSKALEAAGAIVHQFHNFGSYQGSWLAEVTLPDGNKGWIVGSFGSCSGCDHFQAEFNYDWHSHENHPEVDGSVYGVGMPGCEECETIKLKLIKFGEAYFPDLTTAAEIVKDMLTDSWWSEYDEDPKKAMLLAVASEDMELVRQVQEKTKKLESEEETF